LATREEVWRLRVRLRGEAVLEARGDMRFMMFHPTTGLSGLDMLTLVWMNPNNPRVEEEEPADVRTDPSRFLELTWGNSVESKEIVADVKHVFNTLNGLNRDWTVCGMERAGVEVRDYVLKDAYKGLLRTLNCSVLSEAQIVVRL
jgi:hypothetical protein